MVQPATPCSSKSSSAKGRISGPYAGIANQFEWNTVEGSEDEETGA